MDVYSKEIRRAVAFVLLASTLAIVIAAYFHIAAIEIVSLVAIASMTIASVPNTTQVIHLGNIGKISSMTAVLFAFFFSGIVIDVGACEFVSKCLGMISFPNCNDTSFSTLLIWVPFTLSYLGASFIDTYGIKKVIPIQFVLGFAFSVILGIVISMTNEWSFSKHYALGVPASIAISMALYIPFATLITHEMLKGTTYNQRINTIPAVVALMIGVVGSAVLLGLTLYGLIFTSVAILGYN